MIGLELFSETDDIDMAVVLFLHELAKRGMIDMRVFDNDGGLLLYYQMVCACERNYGLSKDYCKNAEMKDELLLDTLKLLKAQTMECEAYKKLVEEEE